MNISVNPSTFIGTFKRFGEFGPAYEVIDVGHEKFAKEVMLQSSPKVAVNSL